jgi:hypothetical protein
MRISLGACSVLTYVWPIIYRVDVEEVMKIEDVFFLFIHIMLFFVVIAGIVLLAADLWFLAAILFIAAWFTNDYFKDRCLGLYADRREDCSVDYVIPEIVYGDENIDNGEVIDAEWEEIE